jgi:hypothetical protein
MKHYSDISHLPLGKEGRYILRRKDIFPLDTTLVPFITEQTKVVIKNIKNSGAQGPDQISNIHLKQLGTQGILALTNIANYSIQNNLIPTIWKKCKIITLIKPNKPQIKHPRTDQSLSFSALLK